jgi:hypothetical protein
MESWNIEKGLWNKRVQAKESNLQEVAAALLLFLLEEHGLDGFIKYGLQTIGSFSTAFHVSLSLRRSVLVPTCDNYKEI